MEARIMMLDGRDLGRVGRREGNSASRIRILDTDTEAEAGRDEDLPTGESADLLGVMVDGVGRGRW
jgi:hypothetical protein